MKILEFKTEKEINGILYGIAEIAVESSAELATSAGNMVFTTGSLAWDITTGIIYGLASETWYIQNGGKDEE